MLRLSDPPLMLIPDPQKESVQSDRLTCYRGDGSFGLQLTVQTTITV